nr:hypothetical protein Q903MT_gene2623 [Picea sitchensis]
MRESGGDQRLLRELSLSQQDKYMVRIYIIYLTLWRKEPLIRPLRVVLNTKENQETDPREAHWFDRLLSHQGKE